MIQWLGLGAFPDRVQSLIRELRSHKLHGAAKKKKKYYFPSVVVANDHKLNGLTI